MFDLIDKLSKKTENQRRMYAGIASLCFTVLVFGVWLSIVLYTPFDKREVVVQKENLAAAREERALGPIKTFGKDVATAFVALKGQMGEMMQNLNLSSDVYMAEQATSTSFSPQNQVQE